MRCFVFVVMFLTAVSLCVSDAAAQGAVALVLTPSARSIAMAETGGADVADPMNSFLNPAVLATQIGVYLSGFYGEVSGDYRLRGGDLSGGYRFDVSPTVTVGVGGQIRHARLNYGETFSSEPHEGYWGIGIAAGVTLQNRLDIGIGWAVKKWDSEDRYTWWLGTPHAEEATAYDVGGIVSYTFGDDSDWHTVTAAGISVLNMGDSIESSLPFFFRELPEYTNYALSVRISGPPRTVLGASVPTADFTFNLDVADPGDHASKTFRLGLEAAIARIAFFRLGWEAEEHNAIDVLIAGLGVGLPSRWVVVRVDYALVPIELIGTGRSVTNRDNKFSLLIGVPLG
jgi:hypothetical protein